MLKQMLVVFFIKYKYREEKKMSFYSKVFPYILMGMSFIPFFIHEDKMSNDLEYYLKVSKIDSEEEKNLVFQKKKKN